MCKKILKSINKSYIKYPEWGVIRIGLIVSLLAGWIACAVSGNTGVFNGVIDQIDQTRTTYLVIAVSGCCISIAIFLLNLFDSTEVFKLSQTIIFVCCDIIFALSILSVSISAAVAESKISNNTFSVNIDYYYDTIISPYDFYRKGSLAAAAAFGIISFILYVTIIGLEISEILRPYDDDDDDDEK